MNDSDLELVSASIDDRILEYLDKSIAGRGGSARRVSRIRMEIGFPDEAEFSAALKRLEKAGRIRLEDLDWIPFVYVWPL